MMLLNGELAPTANLPLPNRGLFFNDGFFETMVWAGGTLRYLPHHCNRMQRAAAALDLVLPEPLATPEALTTTLGRLVAVQPTAAAQRVRVQFWRAGGGLYTPATTAAEWLATAQPFEARETPVAVASFADTVRTAFSPASFCKGPNALLYVLAARERVQRGLDDILLLSPQGHVAEAGAAAVGWIRGGAVYGPAETAGGVAGTRAAHLRGLAEKLGIPWRTDLYEPTALLGAEAVFTANVAGIRAVQRVGKSSFASDQHPVLAALREADRATN